MKINIVAASFSALLLLFIIAISLWADSGRLGLLNFLAAVPLGDKLGHFFLYGLLTFGLIAANFHRTLTFKRIQRSRLSMFATIPKITIPMLAIVTVEELSQYFIESRTLDAYDMLANILGIGFFSWISLKQKNKFIKL